jgi:geranylgeranyl diphosphate synthase, type I
MTKDAVADSITTTRSARGSARDFARQVVLPPYKAAVQDLPEPLRHVIGYHAGWLDRRGHSATPTSRFTLAALLLTCAQYRVSQPGDDMPARKAAVAISAASDAAFLHDDITDKDFTRRGRPAAWTVFGTARAQYAGCVLYHLGAQQLPGEALVREYLRMVRRVNQGQFLEAVAEGRDEVTIAEYMDHTRNRGGDFFAGACVLGALAAGADADQLLLYRSLGVQLGICYQLKNDCYNLWAVREWGKTGRSDLANRKKSAPVVAALNSRTPAGDRLAELYSRHNETQADDDELLGLIEEAGGRAWAETELADRADAVAASVAQIRGPHRDDLAALTAAIISPQWPLHQAGAAANLPN